MGASSTKAASVGDVNKRLLSPMEGNASVSPNRVTVGESEIDTGNAAPLEPPVLDNHVEPSSPVRIEAVRESGLRLEDVDNVETVLSARGTAGRSRGVDTSAATFPPARFLRRNEAPRMRLLNDGTEGSIGVVRGGMESARDGIESDERTSGVCIAASVPCADIDALMAPWSSSESGRTGNTAS